MPAAIGEGVLGPVLSAASFECINLRGATDFADKVLPAMRKQLGWHYENKRGRR